MTDAFAQTQQIQKRVGDPSTSAWVSANAGTGKTYVLVRRVIRQLLDGARPQAILCITYTKAAAALMAERLLATLSDWSLMAETELARSIEELTGHHPGPGEREQARRLFARALETPGGLKIQTIHSFCTSILSRFPAEAGLPLGFRAVEEDEAAQLMRASVRRAAAGFAGDESLQFGIDRIRRRFSGEEDDGPGFVVSLESVLRDYAQKIRGLSLVDLGPSQVEAAINEATGHIPGDTEEGLVRDCLDGMDAHFIRDLLTAESEAGKNFCKMIERLRRMRESPSVENVLESPFCFTQDGNLMSARYLGKKAWQTVGDFESRWQELGAHIARFRDRLFALRAHEENLQLYLLAEAVMRVYRDEKARLGLLDFDDLIHFTERLLEDAESTWIRYKLDEGIDHILLDEAQDNSATQWQIFDHLAGEILATSADAAGTTRRRSLFVVGDPKQSIYSFQGAEAKLFSQWRKDYTENFSEGFVSESLFLSFRTAQPVLDVVDAIFRNDAFQQVAGTFPAHRARHGDRPGSVELWPSLPKMEKDNRSIWNAAVDSVREESIDRRLANAIADDIERRLAAAAPLACRDGRRTAPHDLMVLFQRRGARFSELLRVLAERGIACAGTDRVDLDSEQAIHDLKSLLRFAANTDDDLSLAELLKSPFFGWDESQLFALCTARGPVSLWKALANAATGDSTLADPAREASAMLRLALDAGARNGPYALITTMLEGGSAETGRRRIVRRLGEGYRDAVDAFLGEALAFEEHEPRSIHAFLHRTERLSAQVKRENQGEKASGVQVMTVHGAKGLEAPVVYLADADFLKKRHDLMRSNPFAQMPCADLPVDLPVLLPSREKDDSESLANLREDAVNARREEYQRLLYVAATRAEEHLVICGGNEDRDDQAWHGLAEHAMARLSGTPHYSEVGEPGALVKRYAYGEPVAPADGPAEPPHAPGTLPQWLDVQAEPEETDPVIYPSGLGDVPEPAGTSRPVGDPPVDARRRGILIHKLLEILPTMPQEARRASASKVLAPHQQSLGAELCDEIASAAISVLDDPQLAELFGPGSRGEVAVQGQLDGATVSGTVDRLVVTPERVVVAEFKTTRWVPEAADAIPSGHVAQVDAYRRLLATVYPGRDVTACLLYIAGPKLFIIG